jgi:hypothetical protein
MVVFSVTFEPSVVVVSGSRINGMEPSLSLSAGLQLGNRNKNLWIPILALSFMPYSPTFVVPRTLLKLRISVEDEDH